MNLYEVIVETYLTTVESLLVLPQAKVEGMIEGNAWAARPDFVAIDFAHQELQVVEVTKDYAKAKMAGLAEKLRDPHRGNLESLIRSNILHSRLSYPVIWRFIVRRSMTSTLRGLADREAFVQTGGQIKIDALEDILQWLQDALP